MEKIITSEEELREKIADLFSDFQQEVEEGTAIPYYDYADQILTLIREAGWRSPEEINQRIDIILGLGEKKQPQ